MLFGSGHSGSAVFAVAGAFRALETFLAGLDLLLRRAAMGGGVVREVASYGFSAAYSLGTCDLESPDSASRAERGWLLRGQRVDAW